MQNKKPKIYHNRKHRIAVKARKKRAELTAQQNGQCYWCNKSIVAIETIDPAIIIKRTHSQVTIRDGNNQSKLLLATIDHVKSIAQCMAEGIESQYINKNNLVASCFTCNHNRANPKIKPQNCKRCNMPTHKRRYCKSCTHQLQIENHAHIRQSILSRWSKMLNCTIDELFTTNIRSFYIYLNKSPHKNYTTNILIEEIEQILQRDNLGK